ncbi:MAG: glycosyltransferase family 2 protein [Bdellovibrio sp.]|nr:MAG: glycosyltransferase family 2 protein [Bdellovibrio sp.]
MALPISVIIVNHNAGKALVDCVGSVKEAQQIIVVDNASQDNSLSLLKPSKNLQVIRAGKNLGFAAGCNLGIAQATEAHLLFLNPDCKMSSQSLERLLQVLDSHPQAGMAGGLLLNEDGTEQGGGRRTLPSPWMAFVRAFGLHRLAKWFPRLFSDFYLHNQPVPEGPTEVEAISGACMLVKKRALEDVGPWDEGYFLHCEDLDWCMRFHKRGWKILFVPDAVVIHQKGVCSHARPVFVEWHKHKGMLRFYKKFFRERYSALLWAGVVLGVWVRFCLVAVIKSSRLIFKRAEA